MLIGSMIPRLRGDGSLFYGPALAGLFARQITQATRLFVRTVCKTLFFRIALNDASTVYALFC